MYKQNVVLIVDDSKENINALRSALEDKYSIRVALNGQMALKAMMQTNVDLVLLDVIMPGMDGFEVLEKMKESERLKNIPVIFVTGELDSYSESKGLMLGAFDYVTKPYNADIVQIKVRNQLENKMYRDRLESLVEQRTEEILASRDALVMGMSLVAESRDKETGDHVMRVQRFTKIIGEKYLEMFPDLITADEIKKIVWSVPLHDIGKVSVSDTILLKPGRLTDEEFEIMKTHTVHGERLLRETAGFMKASDNELRTAREIARSHHEKFDGTGYPDRLKGEEIPISARIASLADIFDALNSTRVYKPAFTREEVYSIIVDGDGRTKPEHFDPNLLAVFKAVRDDLY